MPVIEVEHLHEKHGGDGVSFAAERLAGPRILDDGTVSVLCLDPRHDRAELRRPPGAPLDAMAAAVGTAIAARGFRWS